LVADAAVSPPSSLFPSAIFDSAKKLAALCWLLLGRCRQERGLISRNNLSVALPFFHASPETFGPFVDARFHFLLSAQVEFAADVPFLG